MPLQTNDQLGRVLHASCECLTLDERDAVIDALRPLVRQGRQIDLTYSFTHQPTPRHVTLGARVDVFDQPSEPVRKIAKNDLRAVANSLPQRRGRLALPLPRV